VNPQSIFINSLIIGTLSFILYVYYPILQLYNPIPTLDSSKSAYSIEIPKINAYAPIIANVDPWEKQDYHEALKKGVAQDKDLADFGEEGTIYLFAHASLYPWEVTRVNTAFLKLSELHINDEIIITKFEKTYKYRVVDKKEVWPNEVQNMVSTNTSQLILQTVVPLGTDIKRLLIYADLKADEYIP